MPYKEGHKQSAINIVVKHKDNQEVSGIKKNHNDQEIKALVRNTYSMLLEKKEKIESMLWILKDRL